MLLIIDGHNLIPKMPGLSLSEPDKENRLIQLLQEYCRLRRHKAECYFDRAPEGHPRTRMHGTIPVRFARPGRTADDEIKDRLAALGKNAKTYTVVSSDQSVQAAARFARAYVLTSEQFAREVMETLTGSGKSSGAGEKEPFMSQEELAELERQFRARRKD